MPACRRATRSRPIASGPPARRVSASTPTSTGSCWRAAFAAQGLDDDRRAWLDLAPLAGALLPDTYRYGGRSLDDWLAAFGIECVVRHNAAADALATAELLLRLRALAAKQGTRGFAALVKAAKQQKWLGSSD